MISLPVVQNLKKISPLVVPLLRTISLVEILKTISLLVVDMDIQTVANLHLGAHSSTDASADSLDTYSTRMGSFAVSAITRTTQMEGFAVRAATFTITNVIDAAEDRTTISNMEGAAIKQLLPILSGG